MLSEMTDVQYFHAAPMVSAEAGRFMSSGREKRIVVPLGGMLRFPFSQAVTPKPLSSSVFAT